MKNKLLLIVLLLLAIPLFSKAKSQDSVWYVHSFKLSIFKFIPRAEFGGIYEYRFYKRNIIGVKLAYHQSIINWTNTSITKMYKLYRGPVIGLQYNFVTNLRWHEMIGIQLLYKDFKMYPETQTLSDWFFLGSSFDHNNYTILSSKQKLYRAQLLFTTHPKQKLVNFEFGFGLGVNYLITKEIDYAQLKIISSYEQTYTTFANPAWVTTKKWMPALEITCNVCFDFMHQKYN